MSRTYRFNKESADKFKNTFKSFTRKYRKNSKMVKYDTQFIQINPSKRTTI